MSSNKLKIVKAEGAIERFQISKLRRSLALAMSGGECDVDLADPLARAIAMYVRGRRSAATLSTQHVFECAQAVLRDTGLTETAMKMARHRRDRARRRQTVLVGDLERPEAEPAAWSKQRVVEAIERQFRLRMPVARILAAEIERRVLQLDYKMISTGLVREVIRNEMLAWGLVCDEVLQGKLTFE